MQRFEGRTAIITGGAKGIGRATVLRYLAEGGRVAVFDQEPDESAFARDLRTAAGTAVQRLVYVTADMTREGEIAAAVGKARAALGEPDILINNVGFGWNPTPIEEVGLDDWNRFLSVNLTSAFLMTRAVLPGMRARKAGAIVNLCSIAGRSISEMSNVHYSAAKAGIMGLTRKLAYEEGPNNVRINAVAPGTVFTDRVRARWEAQSEEAKTARMAFIPMRRAARPEEIAAAILFLASDDASYITGAILDVNGGRHML